MINPTPEQTAAARKAMLQLAATQGGGSIQTGSATASAMGDAAAYLPKMMHDQGIAVPELTAMAFKEVTGLDCDPAREVELVDGKYRFKG